MTAPAPITAHTADLLREMRKEQALSIADALITAAARALNKRHAELCNVNEADSWMIQGDDFRDDAIVALTAAGTALAALSGPQDERAAFERWYFSLEEAMWYSGIQSAIAWNAWQARASLAHAPQPASALSAVREPHSMIAGALFDFAGFLTTRPTVTQFGSTADPCSAVDLLTQWAATRGLHLDEADVGGWSVGITDQAQQEGGR